MKKINMKKINMKKGFTMVELVFVIVIIGILSAVALPMFGDTNDQAQLTKGITTLNNVRTAIISESQKRALSGDNTAISIQNSGGKVFDKFNADRDGIANDVLMYPEDSCTNLGCWEALSGTSFKYYLPDGGTCTFNIVNDKLTGSCPKLKS